MPTQASLLGEHGFTGQGVPEGLRFQWPAVPTARAHFIAAMGARGNNERVIRTRSEQPGIGFGLLDCSAWTGPA